MEGEILDLPIFGEGIRRHRAKITGLPWVLVLGGVVKKGRPVFSVRKNSMGDFSSREIWAGLAGAGEFSLGGRILVAYPGRQMEDGWLKILVGL